MDSRFVFSSTFLSGDHCDLCRKPCLTCTNATSCLMCADQLLLLGDQCVSECPEGYYLNDQQCLPCHPICRSCRGPTEDDCRTCTKGFTWDEKQKICSNSCPNGNFLDTAENVSTCLTYLTYLSDIQSNVRASRLGV
jgi:hypothetical protein